MKRFSLAKKLLAAVALASVSIPMVAAETTPTADPVSLSEWSSGLWNRAMHGDRLTLSALQETLAGYPSGEATTEVADRYRASLDQHHVNQLSATERRDASRDEATDELQGHLASASLSQALRSAVEVQSLSASFDDAFQIDAIRKTIEMAEQAIPGVERERDWLLAQELLYRLRTLYEDTSRLGEFERHDAHLEDVNRRVSLLALYAPRRLHELRQLAADRADEEPLGAFNPATVIDWRERVEDVDHRMLGQSLRTAAHEHIEMDGWRPLLRGGLRALRLLATTPALDESFTTLRDADAVGAWVDHIDVELERLKRMKSGDLDRWTYSSLVKSLIEANDETLKLPRGVLYREFGDGAMYELDRFSEIIWPDKLRRFEQSTEGNFVGVGILIRHNEKREIMVVNPLEGSPAYFAGVQPDDLIVSVDDEPTVGWSLNDAVDEITGPRNSTVTLGLKRAGIEDPVQITISRDVIKLRSVRGWWKSGLDMTGEPEWDWYIDPVSRVAYIRLTQFSEDTYTDLKQAWAEINENGRPRGLILDLRYNPGGLLTSAVQISNLFVKDGLIVSGENKNGQTAWRRPASPFDARISSVPTVVLVNKGSASASEIVAGCLQAHGAAVILGERSYGKGSVQTVHPIDRQARLKLTTQYYRLPPPAAGVPGRLVHKRPGASTWGVDPDVLVTMTPWQVTESLKLRRDADLIPQDENGQLQPDSPDRPDVNAMLADGLDPQISTALLILQARAMGLEADSLRADAGR